MRKRDVPAFFILASPLLRSGVEAVGSTWEDLMKITIESTTQMVMLEETKGEVLCRVWEGETDTGIKVQVLIPRIAAKKGQNLEQFEREMIETRPPSAEVRAFPARMIL
jgi:hypothetical protein